MECLTALVDVKLKHLARMIVRDLRELHQLRQAGQWGHHKYPHTTWLMSPQKFLIFKFRAVYIFLQMLLLLLSIGFDDTSSVCVSFLQRLV